MIIGSSMVYLRADWVTSLKEKRMVLKSIIEKTRHKFNVSVAEIEKQDDYKSLVIGFACVSNSHIHAENMVQNIIDFIEMNTDAEVIDIITEIF